MYDMSIERSSSTRFRSGRTGVAASVGWALMVLAISVLVAWAELRADPGAQSIVPEESACLHPRVCIG